MSIVVGLLNRFLSLRLVRRVKRLAFRVIFLRGLALRWARFLPGSGSGVRSWFPSVLGLGWRRLLDFITTSHHLRKAKSQGVSRYRRKSGHCGWSRDCQIHGVRQRRRINCHGWKDCGSIVQVSPELVCIGSLTCVGVPLSLTQVPGTFLMEARCSEGFNPELDVAGMIQVCILFLSVELFDSITSGPATSRTAVQALLERSLNGDAEHRWRRRDSNSAWKSANHRDSS